MRVVVPVKRFDLAKQRLSPAATVGQRVSLARDMAERVLRELGHSLSHDGVLVVSNEDSLRPLVAQLGFDWVDDPGAGINAAIGAAVEQATSAGCRDVAIVHADLPLFLAAEFDRVAVRHLAGPPRKLTLVSDRHDDGTTALFCRPADAFRPSYGPASASRHRAAAKRLGMAVEDASSPTLSADCDTPDDLRHIAMIARAAATGARLPAPGGVDELCNGAQS